MIKNAQKILKCIPSISHAFVSPKPSILYTINQTRLTTLIKNFLKKFWGSKIFV